MAEQGAGVGWGAVVAAFVGGAIVGGVVVSINAEAEAQRLGDVLVAWDRAADETPGGYAVTRAFDQRLLGMQGGERVVQARQQARRAQQQARRARGIK